MNHLTVTNLNKYIKTRLESDERLKSLSVVGEVSNLKIHYTGHWYFTLKDERSRISAVMFSTYSKNVNIKITDGMKVVLKCYIGVYEQGGNYQIYVQEIEPLGLGTLYLQFEELKKTLNSQGLFSEQYKKAIPKYPTKIGVISAPQGAAIQDVMTTLRRRWPIAEIELIPTLVQGNDAANDIVNSLIIADRKGFDVIIMTRGGGSIEDLWSFNEEKVARQIFKTTTPIISAIGHETDFTIADYVADLRAPTPTAAAELATPNFRTVQNDLKVYDSRLNGAIANMLKRKSLNLEVIQQSNVFKKPELIYANKLLLLDNLRNKLILGNKENINSISKALLQFEASLKISFKHNFTLNENKFTKLLTKLDALSPLKVIERGYALVYKDGKLIKTKKELEVNDDIEVRLSDGQIKAKVINKGEE